MSPPASFALPLTAHTLTPRHMEKSPNATACYENAIPGCVTGKLELLYGSMYASFTHFDLYGGLEQASTYIAYDKGGIHDILLYRKEKHLVRVLNEQMHLDDEAIVQFAHAMFEKYPDVDTVILNAIDAELCTTPYPLQRYFCTNDISMPLPPTVQAYYEKLGKSTRKTLNQNGNRLQKRHPSFRFEILETTDIGEIQLREIIALNHARMAGKSRVSAIDETEATNIIAFARRCGLIGLVSIDGKVCAGAICYRIGTHYHLRVIGHDPLYNAYGLGMWCCYRTICECIARGGSEFHFMWGHEEYKYRLLGVQRNLSHVVLYRSRARMLVRAKTVIHTALTGWKKQCQMWILERLRHKDHWAARRVHQSIAWLRNMRRMVAGTGPNKKTEILQLSQKE